MYDGFSKIADEFESMIPQIKKRMPKFVKDETDKAVLGIGLSAFLLGAFVCGLIDTFVN